MTLCDQLDAQFTYNLSVGLETQLDDKQDYWLFDPLFDQLNDQLHAELRKGL